MTSTRIVTVEEVQQHKSRNSVWFVVHNKVYDVTKFLEDHPGGEEVLIEQAGKDATEIFDDVSHSSDAKVLMKQYFVGDLEGKDSTVEKEVKKAPPKAAAEPAKPTSKPTTKPIRHFNDNEHSLSLTWGQWAVTAAVSIASGLLVRYIMN